MIEHRVLAPCFLEALDQDGVLGLQENDAVVDAARAQFVQALRESGEEGAVAHVQADGHVHDRVAAHVGEQAGEMRQQHGRQVVDAVETDVFQGLEGNGLSGSGQTADDEKTHLVYFAARLAQRLSRQRVTPGRMSRPGIVHVLLMPFHEILEGIEAPHAQDVGADGGFHQYRQVAAGADEQRHLRNLHVEDGAGHLLRFQAVDLAHFLALDGFQAHDQVQLLLVPYRGLAEHEPHVQDAQTAYFQVIREQRRTLAHDHVRADADKLHGIVRDQAVIARQQLEREFAFADAGLARDQHAHAHDFHVHAVHRDTRSERARQVVLEVIDHHRAGQRRREQTERSPVGGGDQVGRDIPAVRDDDSRSFAAGKEVADRLFVLLFIETGQVRYFRFTDDLDAVRVDEIEMTHQRHARILGGRGLEQAVFACFTRNPFEFQRTGLRLEKIVRRDRWYGHGVNTRSARPDRSAGGFLPWFTPQAAVASLSWLRKIPPAATEYA